MKRPFNKAKYKALLKGLEVSEVNLELLESGTRFDAELYGKNVILLEKRLKKHKHTILGKEVKLIKKGIFDIKADTYSSIGIPFVRISNLKNMIIDTSDIIYIPKEENDKNLSTFLKTDDIILSKTANAAASIVNIPFCNTSQDTVAIKLKGKSQLNSHFIVVYLNTKYGLQQMQRWFTGNIQMHLNLNDCKNNLLMPIYSTDFQNEIKRLFEKSLTITKESKRTYSQAENLFLQSIGLKNFKPTKESVNVKSFKESFLTSGRLDAEYYQPKYEEIINRILPCHHNKLGNLVSIKKSIEPGSAAYADEGIPFMRVADYNKFGINDPVQKTFPCILQRKHEVVGEVEAEKRNHFVFKRRKRGNGLHAQGR